ncbi:hypothetical protein [Amycolatopsis speibonae]|uniref:DUF4158 domain-containing protein n=1 Tax=Amycolatopsis speibonae TaxID=1450224 RepID=A0ABV7NWL9_9PSEU
MRRTAPRDLGDEHAKLLVSGFLAAIAVRRSDLLGSSDIRMDWSDDELAVSWTLVGEDWSLVGNKTGATRLGFAVLLKFFEIEARFPADGFADYAWSGGRSNTTGRRFVLRSSRGTNSCAKHCWCAVAPNGSSRRAGLAGSAPIDENATRRQGRPRPGRVGDVAAACE